MKNEFFESVKDITTSDYFSGEKYSTDIFSAKYSHTKADKSLETPAEVFWRIATGLAELFTDKEEAHRYAVSWFNLMWEGWFRPGGSVITGVGAKKKISLNNCTTVPLHEDTLESIAQTRYWLKKVAAYRQGVGFDASNLRPRHSLVNNAAEESTGTIPWIDDLVNIGKKVGQKGRMPALLVSLKVQHPDIEEFISCKDDLDQITNANISVQINDAFMTAVENDTEWELSFDVVSTGEKIRRMVNARKLFRKIAEHAHKSAEPGVQYIDKMRQGSMVHAIYTATGDIRFKIISTNACSEKPLAGHSVCNLLSLNMEMFGTEPADYKKQLEYVVPYAVTLSDKVVDYEIMNKLSPLKEQAEMVQLLREVGMGITNVHGWLLKQDIPYDSDEAVEKVSDFMKHYAYNVFKTSMELGKKLGNAPAFDLVEDKTKLMAADYFRNIVNEFFDGDPTKVTHMRNMAHMSIAPSGSISSVFPSPCISSGIEPVIGLYYWRRTRAIDKGNYTHYFVIPNRLKEYVLGKMEKGTEDYMALSNFSGTEQDEDGKVGKALIEIMHKYIPEGFFKPAHEINPMQKIKLMSSVYKWMDAAVSCTYNLPNTATVDDVEQIYMEAYKQGVRAVSVYVDGSRQGILIFEDPVTNKLKYESNKSSEPLCSPENRPKTIIPVCAPKRPDTLECNIHHCSVKGTPWLVIVGLMDGMPYEIFAGEVEEGLYVPKTCKSGKISKRGGSKYSLEIMIRNAEVEYKDLAQVLMTSNQRALTRLLSLALRHGTPPEFIQQQLRKANGEITDFSAVVARVLGMYIKQNRFEEKSLGVCPACGKESLMRIEGCIKCAEEGCMYSRCD